MLELKIAILKQGTVLDGTDADVKAKLAWANLLKLEKVRTGEEMPSMSYLHEFFDVDWGEVRILSRLRPMAISWTTGSWLRVSSLTLSIPR